MKRLSKNELLAQIYDTCYVSNREAVFIYKELEKLPPKGRLLELGTGRAHSTYLYSHALPDWVIYTIDAYGSAGTPPLLYGGGELVFDGNGVNETHSYIKARCLPNVIQIVGGFSDIPWELPIDALFIDGSHWYDDVKADWEKFSPFLTEDGLAIMHDYNYNFGVQDFFEKDVIPSGKWKVWNKETIGFAKRK